MGGDPTIPDIPLMVKPITGNDIFKPQVSVPTPSIVDDTFYPDVPVDSPTPPPSLPRSIPQHSIGDDDFPPDTIEYNDSKLPHTPPQPPEFPSYPSMETSDTDENEREERAQHEIGLDEFMDLEYLKQGKYHSSYRFCHPDA